MRGFEFLALDLLLEADIDQVNKLQSLALKGAKMAYLEILDSPKFISRKI